MPKVNRAFARARININAVCKVTALLEILKHEHLDCLQRGMTNSHRE